MMNAFLILLGLCASFFSLVSGTALTYKLSPGEQACFFSDVPKSGVKIAFYFAVSATGSTALMLCC